MSELSSIHLPRDPGPLNFTNLNSIKLMELDFSAPLEGFQISNHVSPFPDPSLTEAKGGLLPGFPSAMLHTPKGLAERQNLKKGRVCGVHLPPSHFLALMALRQNESPARAARQAGIKPSAR